MSVSFEKDGERIVKIVKTPEQTAKLSCGSLWQILLSTSKSGIKEQGIDSVTVTIEIVSRIQILRGVDKSNLTVFKNDDDVRLTIDGNEVVKTLTDGSVSFNITTEKPAGSTIEIVAESLADHPAESDSATIEVVSQ